MSGTQDIRLLEGSLKIVPLTRKSCRVIAEEFSDRNLFSLTTADTTTNSLPTRADLVCEMLSIRKMGSRILTPNSSLDMPGRRPIDLGACVERAKSRVCPTVM